MLSKGALTGLKVLDLSRLLPGPYCSMILADHGARVISIEDRRFEAESSILEVVRRNKEHITLNLKSDEGKAIFFNMVRDADIVLEGFRPGVVKKLGVDYESVKKVNPGIIYCSITGYGQTGPNRDTPGHDVNYLGNSGLLDLMGKKGQPPSIPGFQIADIAGGGMNAVIGILLALQARTHTKKGQYIDISMTDGCLPLLSLALDFRQILGQPLERSDSVLSHRYAFYNTYETKDKNYISIGCLEFRFWINLCKILNTPDFISLQYDENCREKIINTLRNIFKSKTLAQWNTAFEGQDICWGPVQSLDEVMESPLFNEREMILDYDTEQGLKKKTFGVPIKLSTTPGSMRTPPVSFGQSTVSVLKEHGYSDKEIELFHSNGAI